MDKTSRLGLLKESWSRVGKKRLVLAQEKAKKNRALDQAMAEVRKSNRLMMVSIIASESSHYGKGYGHLPLSWNLSSKDRRDIKKVEQWVKENPDSTWQDFPHTQLKWAWEWVQKPPKYGTSIRLDTDWFDCEPRLSQCSVFETEEP